MTWELTKGVHSVGVQDWDRRLFDELIPLPDGTSYNAYLIKGNDKTALIDTVNPNKGEELLNNLKELGVERIDYVISNHAEQDHSGAIPKILDKYPMAKVVANQKCKEFLKDLLLIEEDRFTVVNDGDTMSLGDKTLEFINAPWVHWPETMLTLLREDKILFTCDLFGSHLASSDKYATDGARVLDSAKRYYAEIMMPFRAIIRKHLGKLKDFDFKVIAPSHGPVYDKPGLILDAYRDWTSNNVKNEVVIPYVSMYGSTQKMVEYLTKALAKKNITVKPYNLTKTDIGELAIALVDAATIVIASPTVLIGPHPQAVYAAYLANALRPKAKFASIIGSYCWGGRMVEQVTSLLNQLNVELIEPVMIKGHPKEKDYELLDKLADKILEKHTEEKIMEV